MTNYHKRWLCNECKREWHDVHQTNANGGNYVNSAPETVTGNPPGDNCPICGSPEIVEVAYKPRHPGLDIPRNGEFIVLPRRKTLATIPGLTSTQDRQIHSSSNEIIPKPEPEKPIEPKVQEPPLALTGGELKVPTPNNPNILHEDNTGVYDASDMD